MAVNELGIDYQTAIAYANKAADRIEGSRSRHRQRALQKARRS